MSETLTPEQLLEKSKAVLAEAKAKLANTTPEGDQTIESLSKVLEQKNDEYGNVLSNMQTFTEVAQGLIDQQKKLEEGLENTIDVRIKEREALAAAGGSNAAQHAKDMWADPKPGENKLPQTLQQGTPAKVLQLEAAEIDYKALGSKDSSLQSDAPFDGGAIGTTPLYSTLIEANPFRQYITAVNRDEASFKLPTIADIPIAKETTIPAAHQARGVEIDGDTVYNVENWVGEVTQSNFAARVHGSAADILRNRQLPRSMGRKEARDVVAAIEGVKQTGTDATNRKVKTGVAASLGATNDAIISSFLRVRTHVSVAYREAGAGMWFCSPEAEDSLWRALAGSGGLMVNPATGLPTFHGSAVKSTDYVDSVAANSISVFYGDLSDAVYMGIFLGIRMNEYTQPHPRATLYDIQEAYKTVLWDSQAIAVLKTEA